MPLELAVLFPQTLSDQFGYCVDEKGGHKEEQTGQKEYAIQCPAMRGFRNFNCYIRG